MPTTPEPKLPPTEVELLTEIRGHMRFYTVLIVIALVAGIILGAIVAHELSQLTNVANGGNACVPGVTC